MAGLIQAGLKSLRRVRIEIRDTASGTVIATSNGVKDKANTAFLPLTNDFRKGDGWYESDFNPTVKIEAKPKAGAVFMGWSGDLTGNANPATLRMDRNYAIVAIFAPAPAAILPREGQSRGSGRDVGRMLFRGPTGGAGTHRIRIVGLDGRATLPH